MALDRVFNTPTMTIDQSRYEELIRTELKCEQYKAEFERRNDNNIINVVEAKKYELTYVKESEVE